MNAWRFLMRGGDAGQALEIDAFGAVGDDWFYDSVTATSVARRLKSTPDLSLIKIRINSEGGDAFEGFAIYNLLKEHKARVEVDIIGLAASAASIIAMAGDVIRIESNGWMMIHNAAGIVRGESEDMKRWSEVLQKISDQAADIYAARTGLDKAACAAMMKSTTWMTASEAKEYGFVDEVVPFKKGTRTAGATQRAGMSMGASALAFMKVDDYDNVPDELRAAIESARSAYATRRNAPREPREPQQQLFEDPGPAELHQHPQTGERTNTMEASLAAFLATAGIASAADLNARLAFATRAESVLGKTGNEAIAALEAQRVELAAAKAMQGKLETLTGKTGEDVMGVLAAHKQSHVELVEVRAELSAAQTALVERDLESALQVAKTEARHTPARETNLRKMIADKEITPKGALAMIGEWGVVQAIQGSREPKQPAAATGGTSAALTHEGKTYAELKPAQRAALKRSNPDLFAQMHEAYEADAA